MEHSLRILGISGSLRQGSYNTALLRAAAELLPAGMQLELADISRLPLYNEDLRPGQGFPEPVRVLREQIAAADALLIATPEYNHSIPGVLKNAIDWASRSPDMPLYGKPAAILGASGGMMGTVRAQQHLRQILTMLNVYTVNKPEVLVGQVRDKFDADGHLTDETARKLIVQLLENLREWTLVLQQHAHQPTAA